MDVLKFHEQMESNGCIARMISIDHLDQLKEDVEKFHKDGLLDESVYRSYLTRFKYELPTDLTDAKSIVVVARPQPMLMIFFRSNGREIPLIIPPTYADGVQVDDHAISALKKVLGSESYRFVKAKLPMKALAARSGLASFGRNNITYVRKFGSFHRLTAFYSDFPCHEDQWQEMQMMVGCESCGACLQACPTGAISEERFLLKAEKCLTYFNEKSPEVPFPDWVEPSWHNAIVGCMRCQRVCPYNKGVMGWAEARGDFSEEETEYLLRGEFVGDEAKSMEEKLKKVGLDLTVFPRNLAAILKAKE